MSTIDNEALRWAVRNSEGEPDEAQRHAFDAWYEADIRHKGAYLRATAINKALNQTTVQETLRPHRERLQAEWAGASWQQPTSRRSFLIAGGLAASVALAAAVNLYPRLSGKTVLVTAKGEFRKVPLADRSVVTINSASLVEVNLSHNLRQIALKQGEALFEVAKDKSKPFVVESGDARVRAVGTAFSVRRFGNGSEVLVTEGTVEVWSEDGTAQKQLLNAGDQTFVADRASTIAVSRRPEEIQRKLAWKEGRLVFLNQTLGEAVADFNRYSSKRIVIVDPDIEKKTFVGQYQIDAPESFARDVSDYLGVPLAITADQILIGVAKAKKIT